MLIVVEGVNHECEKSGSGCRLYGSLQPVAVVVCAADEAYALGVLDKHVQLGSLLREVPDLDAMIAAFEGTKVEPA